MNSTSQSPRTPPLADPRVSIVIPCRDRASQLSVCLAAVRELDPAPAEVIVVDSASRVGSAIRDVSVRGGAHYLRIEIPGVSLAKNIGARNATGDIVAFLDDDAIPSKSWLGHLLEPFRDPHIACVTSRTVPNSGDADVNIYRLLGYMRGPNSPDRISPQDAGWVQAACFGGIGITPGLALRKSVYEEWPGFCERLGAGTSIGGNEEGHAFLDLVRLGYSIQYAREALVFHPVPAPDDATLQKRYYSNLAAATGFILMLMFEERGCRLQALKYLASKFHRVSSFWNRGPASQQVMFAPRWRVVLARASGVLCYLRSLGPLVADIMPGRAGSQPLREGSSKVQKTPQ